MRTTIYNAPYNYLGENGFHSCCDLTVCRDEEKPLIVIASERPDNPGASITNAAAAIATQAFREFQGGREGLIFIEHYPEDGKEWFAKERFAQVFFETTSHEFSTPRWKHISKTDVMALIDEAH